VITLSASMRTSPSKMEGDAVGFSDLRLLIHEVTFLIILFKAGGASYLIFHDHSKIINDRRSHAVTVGCDGYAAPI
jgi:hypothetical protein